MNFRNKLGISSVLATACYIAGAEAADYNTRIYSVAIDEQNGVLHIDGADLAPAGAPATGYVQLLGQTLVVHAEGSSGTHLEATLPSGISLVPRTGYQLYVSPDRAQSAGGATGADQAAFTLYVTSKVEGGAAAINAAHPPGSAAAAAPSRGGAGSTSATFLNSLGSAFSLNSHSTSSNISNGPTPNNGSTFSLPYTGSLGSTSTLFSLTNTGTGDAIDGISSSTAANSTAVLGMLSSTSPGANATAVRGANSGTNGNGIGVWGSHAGSGIGVNGTSVTGYGVRAAATGAGIGLLAYSGAGPGLYATSNTGQAGSFTITNTSSTSDVHRIVNQGLGRGLFINSLNANSTGAGLQINVATAGSGESITNSNASNGSTALAVNTVGTGMAISGSSTGSTGIYGSTGTISGAGLLGDNLGGGEAVTGRTTSSASATGAVVGRNDGPGYGTYGFIASDTSGNGIGVLGRVGISGSKGVAGHFENLNSSNGSNALEAVTNGTGSTASFSNTNNANTSNTLYVTTNGPGVIADHSQGNAGNFFINNTSGVGAGVRGETNSIFGNGGTAGVYGVASGTGGYGGYFEHTNSSGFGLALQAITSGQGVVAHFETVPTNNAQPTLQVVTAGTGNGATITNNNNTSTANTLDVTTNGPGVIADHSQGNAGNFFNNNTSGVGAGVRGEVNSIFGNNGTAGVYGVASGTGGYAGYFEHTETTGFGETVHVISNDQGTGLVVDKENANGDPAIFQHSGSNVARIDNTGKGFFNGGTQTGGADLAEFVPTIGATPQVGDVVEIDPQHPNSFRLCAEANTTRVAGIISTAPGVTLNAKDGARQEVSGPALALAGRVPTKVNNRGGAIHIGDLLVASSEPGRAMRAPAHPEPGTVIGKALQDSDAVEGSVEVLVMLR